MNRTRGYLGIAAVLGSCFMACNYTDGECFPREELYETAGVGGGVIVPTGVGGYGNVPFEPQDASGDGSQQGLACNAAEDAPDDADDLMQSQLEDDTPLGGANCFNVDDCYTKCGNEAKYCVHRSSHPYKPGLIGDLYDCIDTFPKAASGGSYTCLYRYSNGDACIFAYPSKFGPITIPAPPPLCVYKSK